MQQLSSPSQFFCVDHVYKLRRVRGSNDFISLKKTVNRLRRRQYDPMIIKKTIGLVFVPSSSEATASCSPSPLIVSRDSFSLWTWARVQTVRSTAYLNGCPYDILLYYYICLWTTFYDLSDVVGCRSSVSIRRTIYKFLNVCPFDYTAVVVSVKVERS